MQERVQKLMARADIGSRRACEEIIESGRVTVNDKVISLGDKADPDQDVIKVDGQRLKIGNFQKRYYVFNKPINVLSTNKAPAGDDRPTVRELIPVDGHLFTIGRLDAESEGLMVLTNDGELTHELSHPRFEHTKTYKVIVYGQPSEEDLLRWESGVWLDGTRTAPCYVKLLETDKKTSTLRFIMIEGRKRQIRRTATLLGYPVKRLMRTHIGKLGLGTLRRGMWYAMGEEEVEAMLMPADEIRFIKRKNRRGQPRRDKKS